VIRRQGVEQADEQRHRDPLASGGKGLTQSGKLRRVDTGRIVDR